MPIRSLPLLVCLLAGCSALPRPASEPVAPCPPLAALPARALSDREVEIYWGRDIEAYQVCKGRLDTVLGVKG